MNKILKHLSDYTQLTETEAYDALKMVVAADCSEVQSAAFLSAYIMRKPGIEELRGFRHAMMELCIPVTFSQVSNAVDIVGTGGDGKNSFNISTLASIVTAAAECYVIKHGNYGVSSISGSSNVLEYLGYRFTNKELMLQQQLDKCNICFLHAPLFHPAMKTLAPVRKNLGMRSLFNLLGPLTNPARPAAKLLGVNSLETARVYQYLLQGECEEYMIVHALDGYDEISLTGNTKLITRKREEIISPEQLGFQQALPAELDGGTTVKEAADIFLQVLTGEANTSQVNVVAANSAMAIHLLRPELSIKDTISLAKETIYSKKAFKLFKQLIELSNEHS